MVFRKTPERKFDACQHKAIEYDKYKGVVDGAKLECPQAESADNPIIVISSASPDNYVITYNDFNDKGERFIGYKDQARAYQHLRQVAAEIACKNCPFFSMSPLEVSKTQLERAEVGRQIAENTLKKVQALQATDEAWVEVNAINNRHGIQQPNVGAPAIEQ